MKQRIEELKKKLRIAEQNYNDTRADAYLVEQHQLKEEIATLESMVTPASVSDDSQAQEPAAAPTQSEFQTPTNVEELPSAISRYIVATQGDLAGSMTDKEIASKQRELLGTAREFYEEQNDTDALERVDAMIEKVEAIINADTDNDDDSNTDTDGEGSQNDDGNEGAEGDNDNPEEEEEEKTPTEATETAPAAPQTPKPTKTTPAKKKPTSGKKNGSKSKSKKK
jgi:hypothetical protein